MEKLFLSFIKEKPTNFFLSLLYADLNLRDSPTRFFCLGFFQGWAPPKPFIRYLQGPSGFEVELTEM
jgi:hypothetical protein